MKIRRGEDHQEAMLVVAFDERAGGLIELAAEILGRLERAYFSTLRFERRQKSYLLGRFAAKIAQKLYQET